MIVFWKSTCRSLVEISGIVVWSSDVDVWSIRDRECRGRTGITKCVPRSLQLFPEGSHNRTIKAKSIGVDERRKKKEERRDGRRQNMGVQHCAFMWPSDSIVCPIFLTCSNVIGSATSMVTLYLVWPDSQPGQPQANLKPTFILGHRATN